MTKYKVLDDLADSFFSVDLGLTEEEMTSMFARSLKNMAWREKISADVESAFSDPTFSWTDFFDEHDIYTADNEPEARAYAEKIILIPLRSKTVD